MGLAMSPSPRGHSISAAEDVVLSMVVTLVPTLVVSIILFKFHSLLIATIDILSYILFRCVTHGIVGESGAVNSLDTIMANVLLTFGLPSAVPV